MGHSAWDTMVPISSNTTALLQLYLTATLFPLTPLPYYYSPLLLLCLTTTVPSSSLSLSNLELSDTKVCEPQKRARVGTAAPYYYCTSLLLW